jgi:hypothetical protein
MWGAAQLDQFGTSSLSRVVTNDVIQVQVAIALGARQLIRWPLLAVGSMVAAVLIDIHLGVFLVVLHAYCGRCVLVRDGTLGSLFSANTAYA